MELKTLSNAEHREIVDAFMEAVDKEMTSQREDIDYLLDIFTAGTALVEPPRNHKAEYPHIRKSDTHCYELRPDGRYMVACTIQEHKPENESN